MIRTELNEKEMDMVTGGDYWTDQGYTYVGHSQPFATNAQALSYAQRNCEALRKQYNAYSFAYLVVTENHQFVANYYTRNY